MKKSAMLVCAIALIVMALYAMCPPHASAVILHVDPTGQLTGASGVEVLGSFYDVEFVDGFCASLYTGGTIYGGCNDPSDFPFNQGGALAAAQALLDQVLVDGPSGNFDSQPWLTKGSDGRILTPIGGSSGFVTSYAAINDTFEILDGAGILTIPDIDTTLSTIYVYAVWTPSQDTDGDGILDFEDNCSEIPNPEQADNDGDIVGDVCDPDDDNDEILDTSDNCQFVSNPDQADDDGDGVGNVCDAEFITFSYYGVVDTTYGSPDSSPYDAFLGQTIQVTYTFNTITSDSNSGANGDYIGALTDMMVTVGSNTYTANIGDIVIANNDVNPDQYEVYAFLTGPSVGGISNPGFRMIFSDSTYSVFTSDALPTVQPNPSDFDLGSAISLQFVGEPSVPPSFGAIISNDIHVGVAPENGTDKIIFASNRDGISNFEIYSMNSNGSGVTRLTNNVAHDLEPVWAPDGSKIAFTSYRSGTPDIWVMNADGSNPIQLTSGTGIDGEAAWSPDGTKITFTSTRNGGLYDVFVMNANDGTSQTNLTNDINTNERQPAWSPDGTKIAYTSDKNGGDFDIWVMNADGTGQTDLTQTGVGIHEQNPDWSPDGSKIAFQNLGIFVMNADGTGSTYISGPVNATEPAWSPDGTKITFIKPYDVWVMNADGTGQVNVTNNAAGTSAQNPDWGLPATPSTLSVSAKLRIFAGPPPSFNLSANFNVGGSSDGVNPLTEDVTLQVGTYSVTIPAGSFKQKEKGKKAGAYSFSGIIDGVTLSLQIVAPSVTGDDWSFKASGTPVDLTGLSNPVTVMITIGDDSGTIEVDAIF